MSSQTIPIAKRPAHLAVAALLLAPYGGVLAWFRLSDFYNQHFFDHGAPVILYNLARIAIMPYIFWLVYWVGWAALRTAAGQRAVESLAPSERYILAFFTGAGVWHIGLLVAGLCGLYTYPFALIVTALPLLLSLPHLVNCLDEASVSLKDFLRAAPQSHIIAAGVLAAICIAFIIMRSLYPGGGHDYFTHYFHYYRVVVEHGSILPNEVWYHFFYSKGAGLYFLAMLLTDPLAPALVASVFMLMAAAVAFDLVRRAASGSLWPWVVSALFIGLQLYIRGMDGRWGQLEKLHELTAVTTLALLWCTITFPAGERARQRLWLVAMSMIVLAAVILTFGIGFFYLAFLGIAGILWWVTGYRRDTWVLAACMLTAIAGMIAIMCINYLLTGIPDEHFIIPLWRFLSFEKIREWGVTFDVLVLYYSRMELAAEKVPLIAYAVKNFYRIFRLDLIYPLYLCTAVLIITRWRRGWPHIRPFSRDLQCYAALGIAFILLALMAGRNEPISFYRFSSFIFAPSLCVAVICMAKAEGAHRISWLPPLAAALCLMAAYVPRGAFPELSSSARDALQFASGRYSIEEAYTHQYDLPAGDSGKSAIHPAARAAYNIAGRNARIWTFNPYTYCMLPGCRMESYISFRMSPHSDVIMTGSAEEARRVLQSEGLNYFLVPLNLEIRDPLPLTPLFSPDHIADYLAMRWTDGNSALLTWPGPDTTPLSPEWLARYRQHVAESKPVRTFPMQEVTAWFRLFNSHADKGFIPPTPR